MVESAERTSRVRIQGDLHAENFGTYTSSEGRLTFDVLHAARTAAPW